MRRQFLRVDQLTNMTSLLFSFNGRINRFPYWVVALILIGIGTASLQSMGPFGPEHPMTIGPALRIVAIFIVTAWIGLAVQVKRWHDRDKSAWWALLNLVPIVGQIWVIIECGFLPGSVGDNRFGNDPLARSR